MKKIFSFVVVLAAAAMVSCGGNATKPAEAQVEETVVEAQAEENTCCGACEKCDSPACEKCAEVETEAAAE